jgi:hypothetical protein
MEPGLSLGLEALDRRRRPQRVGVTRPEDFRLCLENLIQRGSRVVGSALPGERHGELVSGLQRAGMIGGKGPGSGGEDLPENRFCVWELALFGEVAGDVMQSGQGAGVLVAQDLLPRLEDEA